MKFFIKIAALVALSVVGVASSPASANMDQSIVAPGIVIEEMSEAEVNALDTQLEAAKPMTATPAVYQPLQNNLIVSPVPLMSVQDGADSSQNELLQLIHGCHKSWCVPRCPRCKFPDSKTLNGHCKANGKLYRCARPQ